jgi:Family of unknown function (DUF5681)
MEKKERRPGDPYEIGFGRPPKRTQFKKGRSGNPKGRPRRKPDLYSELTKILREKITVEGQQERVTVQQALLLRLRDQALRGELWAQKLLQKVVAALPESRSESDPFERQLRSFRITALFQLIMDESAREKAEVVQDPETAEAVPDPVEPENDE